MPEGVLLYCFGLFVCLCHENYMNMKGIVAVMNTTRAVVKIGPEKVSGLVGDFNS